MKTAILIAGLFTSSLAAAQTCTGSSLGGTVGLALTDGSGANHTIQSAAVPFVFNGAECQCASTDLLLDVFMTADFPAGTVGTAELWAGVNCDTDATARTDPASVQCEKLADVDFSQFVLGTASNHVYLPIDSLALFSPKAHQCPADQASNSLYLLFFTLASSNPAGPPAAVCSLGLSELSEGPGAPTSLTGAAGEQAVTVTWSAPSTNLPQPLFYQVLCADASGAPIETTPPVAIYSVCEGGNLQRRALQTTASLPAGGLASLDGAYVCSDPIPPGSGGGSTRISGLEDGSSYQFLVVSVDQYGNPTASSPITVSLASPSSGGCSALPGVPASASWLFFAVLLLVWRRRRLV